MTTYITLFFCFNKSYSYIDPKQFFSLSKNTLKFIEAIKLYHNFWTTLSIQNRIVTENKYLRLFTSYKKDLVK